MKCMLRMKSNVLVNENSSQKTKKERKKKVPLNIFGIFVGGIFIYNVFWLIYFGKDSDNVFYV